MAVTTAAVVGLAATAASTGMSFAQASKQKKALNRAERDAAEAMEAARKRLEVNVYDKLSIQKEPFELEREALLSQGAQAIQAGVESERGAAATAGRIQMAQQEAQAGVRTAMGQQLQSLEQMSAQEDARNRDIGINLDLEEVEGAQTAAANAQELRAQSIQQGFEGVQSLSTELATDANQEIFGKNNPFNQVIGSGQRKADKKSQMKIGQAKMRYNDPTQQEILKRANEAAKRPLFKDLSSLRKGN